jgi:hypothetical protein
VAFVGVATKSASGLLYRRIAGFRRSRASVSHLGAPRALGFFAASATGAAAWPSMTVVASNSSMSPFAGPEDL